MPHILIVEDDPKIAALLADYLQAEGWRATSVGDGRLALALLRGEPVDLVLLDLMLPGIDGIELCRQLRTFAQTPVIMLTARVDEIDRLLGLETGADDYVCKPFSPREVVARVRVHLRRSGAAAAPPSLLVERDSLRILHAGAPLPLTPVEFRILSEMIEHPGRVYARHQLLDLLHEDLRDTSDRTIDSHVKNIRRKLSAIVRLADCVQSVYGVGYRFEPPV